MCQGWWQRGEYGFRWVPGCCPGVTWLTLSTALQRLILQSMWCLWNPAGEGSQHRPPRPDSFGMWLQIHLHSLLCNSLPCACTETSVVILWTLFRCLFTCRLWAPWGHGPALPIPALSVSSVAPQPEEMFLANPEPRGQPWPNYINEENLMGGGEKKVLVSCGKCVPTGVEGAVCCSPHPDSSQHEQGWAEGTFSGKGLAVSLWDKSHTVLFCFVFFQIIIICK